MTSGIEIFVITLATASRFVPGSVTTWSAMTAWSDIRRGGIHRTLRSGLLWGHTRLSFEKDVVTCFGGGDTSRRVCPKIGQGLTEAVETSPAYTNNIDMNPVSQEIADTNFLETKIYSSKYINAKT